MRRGYIYNVTRIDSQEIDPQNRPGIKSLSFMGEFKSEAKAFAEAKMHAKSAPAGSQLKITVEDPDGKATIWESYGNSYVKRQSPQLRLGIRF